ncbi:MAG: pitrilysin family protein [Alphaproteobacteria bacterium]|nr:pitrilysin family protein [Alphaproteobacteria bacterium]
MILENGFKFVFVKNPRVEQSAHYSLIYNVGARDENVDLHKTGLAHFLEHLMFHGTKLYPRNTYQEKIFQAGGEQNAETNYDYTKYYATIPKNQLIEILEIEADRMQHLVIETDAFEKEKSVVLEEICGADEADPVEPYRQGIRDRLYEGHPYQRPIGGIRPDIENLTTNDAYAFYRTYYQPCNATLYIEGDFDFDALAKHIKTLFAPLQNNLPIIRPIINNNCPLNKEIYVYHAASQKNANFNRTYRLPVGDLTEKAALELLCSFLKLKSTSFIQFLIDQKKITTHLYIAFNAEKKDFWNLDISFVLNHELFELHKINKAIDQAFIKMLESEDINAIKLLEIRKKDDYCNICIMTVFPAYAQLVTNIIESGQIIDNLESSLNIKKEMTDTQIKNALKILINHQDYLTSCLLPQ